MKNWYKYAQTQEQAQAQVAQKAKSAGFNILALRGDTPIRDEDENIIGHPNIMKNDPIYLTTNSEVAHYFASSEGYENKPRQFYVKATNIADREELNRILLEANKENEEKADALIKEMNEIFERGEGDTISIEELREHDRKVNELKTYIRRSSVSYITPEEAQTLRNAGYDAVEGSVDLPMFGTGQEIAVLHRNHVKLADPITYDDKGNPIPLEKRFDTSNIDIRY
jgi:hypothetical protein